MDGLPTSLNHNQCIGPTASDYLIGIGIGAGRWAVADTKVVAKVNYVATGSKLRWK